MFAALPRLALALVALGIIGCNSLTAIDLELNLDSQIAPRLQTLHIHVTGDRKAQDFISDVRGKFVDGAETVRYLPAIRSGGLTFDVEVDDAGGVALARGSATLAVHANRVTPVSLFLDNTAAVFEDMGAPADMAFPGGSGDLAVPVFDFTVPPDA